MTGIIICVMKPHQFILSVYRKDVLKDLMKREIKLENKNSIYIILLVF